MADFRAGQVLRAADLNDLAQPGSELIATRSLASDNSFTSIPQDFTHLQIALYGGTDGTSPTDIFFRINDDNGSNYTYWFLAHLSDGSPVSDNAGAASGIRICRWNGVGSRSQCVFTINDYSGSHWQGAASWFGSPGGAGTDRIVGQATGSRDVSEPVSAISFFVVGSASPSNQTIASLYGLR